MPRLQFLCISNNPLGDEGLAPLVAPGVLPPALTHFYPYANQLTDVGLSALLANVKLCRTLEVLNLSSNRISDAGCAALVAACDRGALPTLSQLIVSGNPASTMAQEKARLAAFGKAAAQTEFSNSLTAV